ncbi:hypothetical protein B0H14DRAFT_3163870 [Mycena olivaceomarginata]|nr:hypothetical protein B0H14DRAFT_3163870 [Mycena olivaceomarginata]
MAAFDLKQVGQLFNTIVSAIRDDTPDMDALEPQAIEWLKSARYKLMRDLNKLSRCRSQTGLWTHQTSLLVHSNPPVLEPFCAAITENLETLLKDCGFKVVPACMGVRFPLHLFPRAIGCAAPSAPDLHVEDEFSRSAGGGDGDGSAGASAGSFAAGDFARLLIEARNEGAGRCATE